MKDAHKKYVDELTALSKDEGRLTSTQALALMNRLLERSNGNPQRFIALLKASKKALLLMLKVRGGKSMAKAKKLGNDFAKVKINGAV